MKLIKFKKSFKLLRKKERAFLTSILEDGADMIT